MDVSTVEVYNTADLLALPSGTVILENNGHVHVLTKRSLMNGDVLTTVTTNGRVETVPLAALDSDHQDFVPGRFTAVLVS